jgi:hypothetical protein
MCTHVYTNVCVYTYLSREVCVYTPYGIVHPGISTREFTAVRFLGMLLGSAQSIKYVCFLPPDPANEPAQPARLAGVLNT